MRVLIADRNARLLESISRTFAREFGIQTATTHEQCNEALRSGTFALVAISEKLSDGRGLQLLGQVARSSPDTLRVLVARRARLELLKGKLGPFGLFRTLAYPIDPRELLSVLTLARSGLEIGAPALEAHSAAALETTRNVPATAVARTTREGISLTSADAALAINVPMAIAKRRKVRRSNSASAPRPARVAPPAGATRQQAAASPVRNVARPVASSPAGAREPTGGARQLQQAAAPKPATARQLQQAAAPEPAVARQPQQAAASHPQTIAPQFAPTRHAAPRPVPAQPAAVLSATRPEWSSEGELFELIGERREPAKRAVPRPSRRNPRRARLVLGATVIGVFLATTLTLNLLDARVHVSRAATPRLETARPAVPASPPGTPPVSSPPPFSPTPALAHRVAPTPTVAQPEMQPEEPEIAATNTPIADPSTFGSEAYEVIYN